MTTPTTNAVTQLVQAFLPERLYPKAKAIVAAVLTVAQAVLYLLPYVSGVPDQVGGIIGIVVTVLTPVAVYLTGNEDARDPQHDAEPGTLTVQDAADKARFGTS